MLTGRPAQSGRGVSWESRRGLGTGQAAWRRLRAAQDADDEPLDLLGAIGVPVAERAAAALVAAAAVVIATNRMRRMRHRRV